MKNTAYIQKRSKGVFDIRGGMEKFSTEVSQSGNFSTGEKLNNFSLCVGIKICSLF